MGAKLDELIKNVNKTAKEEIMTVGLSEYDYSRIPFTSPRMNYCTFGGLPIGKLIEFYGEEHGGKALPLDCDILTPTGYKKMRDVKVGDTIISGCGKKTTVIGVYPQGVKPMYRITFSDHTTIDCSDEHLWEVNYHGSHNIVTKVLDTKTLANDYKTIKNRRNYFKYSINTPIIEDITLSEDLPIDPYLLGVLIGDGALNDKGISISLPEEDVRQNVEALIDTWGMELRNKAGTCDYRICHKDKVPNQYSAVKTLRQTLNDLELICKSIDKHIPKEYLFTTIDNRIRLLQGLYDTDGYTGKNGSASFSTSSKKLSEDFAFLVRSLGGLDMVTSSTGTYKKGDEHIECNISYNHNIVFRNGIIPCSSHKHLKRYKLNRVGAYYRKIVNIEPIEDMECQCIKVDALCHTFIAENVTVTHNTTTALDIVANYQQLFPDRDILFVDAENTLDVDWAKKIGVDVDRLTIMQPKSQSAEQIFQIICDAVETDEIGLWVLDSIGVLMSQQEWDKTLEDKTYGGISKPLTQFAKRVESLMAKHKCTGIGINQMREVIGSTFPMQTTPGGKAWKHCCSVRMQFSRGKFVDEKGNELTRSAENPAGNIVMMSMTKNKTCPPTRRTGQYTLNYNIGVDYLKDLVDVAIRYDIIDKAGAWFKIIDPDTGEIKSDKIQGQANVYKLLEENQELLDWVDEIVNTKMGVR